MNILTLNAGSNSLKFEVVACGDAQTRASPFGSSLVSGSIDDIGQEKPTFALFDGKRPREKRTVEAADHGKATSLLLDWLDAGHAHAQGVGRLSDITRVAHRVVHGGWLFERPTRVTPELHERLATLKELAPLHMGSVEQVMDAAEAKLGPECPMYAVFDTAFHHELPKKAALYALPLDLAERHHIRRYGFHGISHQYLMQRFAHLTGRAAGELKLVTLHLEGGSSAAAIQGGRSVDTSMGMTPLEGLIMGTRCGDLDPAIVVYLMRKEGWSADQVEMFLNKQCGLQGVSAVSADTRQLVEQMNVPAVELAIDMFCYRVQKYIGAYLAALGGADAIIFGGGIGENTSLVRERICRGLAWCGAVLDPELNREANDREMCISTPAAAIAIWVVPTQEGLMMAKEVAQCA